MHVAPLHNFIGVKLCSGAGWWCITTWTWASKKSNSYMIILIKFTYNIRSAQHSTINWWNKSLTHLWCCCYILHAFVSVSTADAAGKGHTKAGCWWASHLVGQPSGGPTIWWASHLAVRWEWRTYWLHTVRANCTDHTETTPPADGGAHTIADSGTGMCETQNWTVGSWNFNEWLSMMGLDCSASCLQQVMGKC